MNTERFAINNNDYFEVSLFRYNNEPFVNLRSIHAHIDKQDYDRSDNDLRNQIIHYMEFQDNIDHINYISERLNRSRWFNTAYSNQETDFGIPNTDNEFVLPNDHGQYVPEQLIQSLLVIRPEQYELDDMDNLSYYPIYKFFGRKNASSTFHCVHFDILVYILMNRFPRIRADLTRLLTVELEIVNARNMNMEELTNERLIHLQAENKRLKGENTNLLARVDHLISQNNELIKRNDEQKQQIAYQTSLILQQSGNLDEAREDIRDLLDLNKENSRNLNDLMQASKVMKNELKKSTIANTSTETHKPQLVLFLSSAIPGGKYKKIQPEHSVWIGTKCQEFERSIEHYLPDDAEILFQSDVVGIDILKYILDTTNDIYLDSFYRQVLIHDTDVEKFINKVNSIVIERGNHDAIINLKPITDRIKAREVQSQINTRRQQTAEHIREVKQNVIDNGNLFIYMYGEYRRLYNKNGDTYTEELNASKLFYIRKVINGQEQYERLTVRTLENSLFSDNGIN